MNTLQFKTPNTKKEKNKGLPSFRLRRSGLRVFFKAISKDKIQNSYLATHFKNFNILETDEGCLLCVEDNINSYFYTSNFIIDGVKGIELADNDDALLKFNIVPSKTIKRPNKKKIQDFYDNDETELSSIQNKYDMELDFRSNDEDELLQNKEDYIKQLELNQNCLFEMVKKMSRRLMYLESKYQEGEQNEVKDKKDSNMLLSQDSFYSKNDAEFDSAFQKEYSEVMKELKKGWVKKSDLGLANDSIADSVDIKRHDDRVNMERKAYENIQYVSPKKK